MMETLIGPIAVGILGIIALAQLIALSRRVRNPDIETAQGIYKQMHESWLAGRDVGRSERREDGKPALERQWESVPYSPGEIEDDAPYGDAPEPGLMPDGTPEMVPVSEAPREE